MLSVSAIDQKVRLLRAKYTERDGRMSDVLAIRQGRAGEVFPGLFPEGWSKPIIANFIDVVARDLAELLAPLPAINCSSATMVSDTAKKFADKRTKIAHYYVLHSELQRQMFNAADWYFSYGFVPFLVEPDFDGKCPVIRAENPYGCYPEVDRFGRTLSMTKIFRKPAFELAADYPELAAQIIGDDYDKDRARNALVEVVKYHDKDACVMYLPERGNLPIEAYEEPLGECPWVVAIRPGIDSDSQQRGQFDDVMWVQLAKAKMAILALEAADKSVQAPLAVPSDVQEFAFGGDALIRTSTPEKVRRVGLEMSPAAFQEEQTLEHEMRVGARYPEARSGEPGASIITGRGIQELMGGFDTQIKGAQEVLREMFRKAFRLAFKTDETYFGNDSKTIRGEVHGAPYEITYRPSKDIGGDHTVDITYGFAAGMDPNRWLVWILQLRGDRVIPREFVQRNLPFDVNVTQMQQMIDVEESRDAIKQAIFGMAQALPMLAQQGADPTTLIGNFAALIQALQKGKTLEDAAASAFAPPAPSPEEQAEGGQQPGGAPGGVPEGMNPSTGMPFGVAPGQAGMGQGGRPDLQYLLAGLGNNGKPALAANVVRRQPAG